MPTASPRILVLSGHRDEVVAATIHRLATKYPSAEVVHVLAHDLVRPGAFAHRIMSGKAQSRLRLGDGRWIDESWPTAVLNRLDHIPAPPFANKDDRDYASMELYAMVLSALSGMSGLMVNRPDPRGLSGDQRTPAQWLHLAGRAGLPTRRVRWTTTERAGPSRRGDVRSPWQPLQDRATNPALQWSTSAVPQRGPTVFAEELEDDRRQVTVIGETVLNAPDDLTAPCRRLAGISSCRLLAILLARTERGWVVVHATPRPARLPVPAIAEFAKYLAGVA